MCGSVTSNGMTAVLVNGFWGQNIGNAFFNLGGHYALQQALGHGRVSFIQDQPAYWTFRNEAKGNYSRAFDLIGTVETDLVVVQGPVLTPNFGRIWSPTLRQLAVKQRQWAGIGIGLRQYTDAEKVTVASTLREYPPLFIATRDESTFDFLKSLRLPRTLLHNGIDSAFFCRFAYVPPAISLSRPLVALTFDHFPEPELVPDAGGTIELDGERYRPVSGRLSQRLATIGKATAIVAHALRPHNAPPEIASMPIVRPSHRTNPHLPSIIYRQPGGFASDEPFSYLAIYAAAALTLSDRVHACVASLCYGNAAMFFNTTTKRSVLLDRVGCREVNERPVTLDASVIERERDMLIEFIQRAVKSTMG